MPSVDTFWFRPSQRAVLRLLVLLPIFKRPLDLNIFFSYSSPRLQYCDISGNVLTSYHCSSTMADLAKTTKPLSVVAKLCYAFGGVGGEILWVVFGAYTSIFLVDVAQDRNINSVSDCNERVGLVCPGCWDGRKAGLVHHTVHFAGARLFGALLAIVGVVGGIVMHGQTLASFRRSEHDSCDNMTYSANSSTNSSVDGVSLEMTIGHGGIALYVQYSLDLEDQIENVILAMMVASAAAMPVIAWVVSKLGRKTSYICFQLTGERLDTPFVAIFLSTKSLAITVGLIMATIGLEIGGYKVGSCTQPDTVGSALRILASTFTSVLTFIGVVFAWRYPITEDRRKEITEAINKRKLSRNSQPDETQRNGSLSNVNGKVLLPEETSRPEGLQEEDKLLSSELDLSVLLDCKESVV
uniref:Uncharacterized protein n=1 Tax=Branchiostoma floridae TaxID=7739 RepID=C3Z6M5_BRAFL|eukprot:XP_002595857.1 hypothetical protein BRAFLDRAFT_97127 [Branchiostoma floridae]